jgi:hypothetical protein
MPKAKEEDHLGVNSLLLARLVVVSDDRRLANHELGADLVGLLPDEEDGTRAIATRYTLLCLAANHLFVVDPHCCSDHMTSLFIKHRLRRLDGPSRSCDAV